MEINKKSDSEENMEPTIWPLHLPKSVENRNQNESNSIKIEGVSVKINSKLDHAKIIAGYQKYLNQVEMQYELNPYDIKNDSDLDNTKMDYVGLQGITKEVNYLSAIPKEGISEENELHTVEIKNEPIEADPNLEGD